MRMVWGRDWRLVKLVDSFFSIANRVWLDGHEFPVDGETGEAVVPFAASFLRKAMVLLAGDGFASLAELDHAAESYSLQAGDCVICCGSSVCCPVRQWSRIYDIDVVPHGTVPMLQLQLQSCCTSVW